jgi:polyisoprenoid-binding protein YceI
MLNVRGAWAGLGAASVFFLTVVLAVPVLAADGFARKSPSGKSLIVPDAHQKLGTIYHCLPDRERQVYFTSDAPVEKIRGQSNQVVGYCIAGKDNAAAIQAGEWHLPVKSIRTGNSTRDKHLTQKNWLDAESHPDVVFVLKQVKDLRAEKDRTYAATLVGEMTIHGVTKPITIEGATIAPLPASAATQKTAKGDLMAIRAKYPIRLSEFGVENTIIGRKVAEELSLDTTLYMSTVKPEDQPAEAVGAEKTDGKPKN